MCKYCSHLWFSFIFWQENCKLFFILFFLHWPKSLSNVTMAGNARCQIWGPTSAKHHQKSVIWVTELLQFIRYKALKARNASALKQILEWKSKKDSRSGFTLLCYNLLHRREHWNATAHLDVAFFKNNSYNGREIRQYTGSTNVKSSYLFRS